MADAISIQELIDARTDAKTLEEAVNGDAVTTVLSRLGETYPTLSNALNQIDSKLDSADTQIKQGITNLFENGGLPAVPFATKALMTASALVDGKYAQVTDDGEDNGLYIKSGGVWVLSEYDPVLESNLYTDTALTASNLPQIDISSYAYAITDSNGNPAFSISHDGVVQVSSIRDVNGFIGASGVPRDRTSTPLSDVDIFINNGQSNASGGVPTVPPITTEQLYNNHKWNNNGISEAYFESDESEHVGVGLVNHLTDMTIRDSNTPLENMTHNNMVISVAGTGLSIDLIIEKHNPYLNTVKWLGQIKRHYGDLGMTVNVKAMTWLQGEANASTMSEEVYLQKMFLLYNTYNGIVKEATGQLNDIKLLSWQLFNSNPGKAHIKSSEIHPNIIVVFSKYAIPFGINGHYGAEGTAIAGAYMALAYKRYFVEGRDWQPLKFVSALKDSDSSCLIAFNKGGLVLDTTHFPKETDFGFKATDESGSLPISSVEVVESNKVKIMFGRTVVGDINLVYGITLQNREPAATAIGGNLRDSQGVYEKTYVTGTEYPLHNWALTFEEIVR